jgi:hypothetical protein
MADDRDAQQGEIPDGIQDLVLDEFIGKAEASL